MKTCARCKIEKSTTEFYHTGAGKPKSYCKDCDKALRRERYAANPAVRAAAIANAAQWAAANPERLSAIRKRNQPNNHRKYKYKLDRPRWDAMVLAQEGRCAVCGQPMVGKVCVDHDHSCCPGEKTCGQCVRGLLDQHCNTGIGHLGESPERLRAAAAYLEASAPLPWRP